MKTEVLLATAPDAITRTVAVLRAGGLVAFPTDTVYGLGALAFDEEAVRSIYRAKGRSDEKAIPILLADAGQLEKVAIDIPAESAASGGAVLARSSYDGPHPPTGSSGGCECHANGRRAGSGSPGCTCSPKGLRSIGGYFSKPLGASGWEHGRGSP